MRVSAVGLALGLVLLGGCGGGDGDDVDARGARIARDGLPAPAGTAGGSVTGMPTSAPPGRATAMVEPPPSAVVGEPGAPAVGAESNAIPVDPATGLAVGATPTPEDAAVSTPGPDTAAAGSVVREYMAALGSGAFAGAQQLWSSTPTDSAVLQLARGNAFAVDVMAPQRSADPAAAAAGLVNIPVRVRGTAEDGTQRSLTATYTVRRTAEGAWRIASASVREDGP